MTETVAETEVETAQVDAETPLPPVEDRFDLSAQILVGKLEELVKARNAEAQWLTRNSRDLLSVIDSIKESGDDDVVVAALARIEELQAQALEIETEMDKHLKAEAQKIIDESQNEDEVKGHREAFAEVDKKVRDFKRTLASTYASDDDGPSIEDYFPEEVKLSKGKSGADGPRRLRHFRIMVNGVEAKAKMGGEMKSSFGAGAQRLNTTTAHFTRRYFEVIGSSNKKDFRSAEFEYTHPETGEVSQVEAIYEPPAE